MVVDVKNKVDKLLCSHAQQYSIGLAYGLDCGNNKTSLRSSFNIFWVNASVAKKKTHKDLVRQYATQNTIDLCHEDKSCEKVIPQATIDPDNCQDSCIYVEVK